MVYRKVDLICDRLVSLPEGNSKKLKVSSLLLWRATALPSHEKVNTPDP